MIMKTQKWYVLIALVVLLSSCGLNTYEYDRVQDLTESLRAHSEQPALWEEYIALLDGNAGYWTSYYAIAFLPQVFEVADPATCTIMIDRLRGYLLAEDQGLIRASVASILSIGSAAADACFNQLSIIIKNWMRESSQPDVVSFAVQAMGKLNARGNATKAIDQLIALLEFTESTPSRDSGLRFRAFNSIAQLVSIADLTEAQDIEIRRLLSRAAERETRLLRKALGPE
jgi:hypothetical protein